MTIEIIRTRDNNRTIEITNRRMWRRKRKRKKEERGEGTEDE